MTLTRPAAIIFDWDNTLVDTFDCIRVAINATLRHMGQPEWSLAETHRRVALSLRDAFPAMFGDRWQEARDVFYRTFAESHLSMLRPMPGAAAMLAELRDHGIWLGVVSNKIGPYLRAEADHLGWTGYFGRLVGANDAAADKPAAAPVELVLAESGIGIGDPVWFVGDAPIDMQCAHAAGCTPVLVRAQAPAAGEFDAHPPLHRFCACGELAALVNELCVPISPI